MFLLDQIQLLRCHMVILQHAIAAGLKDLCEKESKKKNMWSHLLCLRSAPKRF